MKSTKIQQRGLSLIELMVSIVVGMIVIAGSVMMFGPMSRSTTDSLRASKLNSDLQTAVEVMGNELRRAGYVSNIGATPPAIKVLDSGTCVLYAYQESGSSIVTWGGFVYVGNNSLKIIQNLATVPADCSGGETWTDTGQLTVTNASFTCLAGDRTIAITLEGESGTTNNKHRKTVNTTIFSRNTTCVTIL